MDNSRRRCQGIYWILTIPHHQFTPFLSDGCKWIKGQLEEGADTGYLHWQILVSLSKKGTLQKVKSIFGNGIHCELSRSSASDAYVWKEDTRVSGTQFELGERPFKRNSSTDWDSCWENARNGNLDRIPSDVKIRFYNQLLRIGADNSQPVATLRECIVFWGPTGSGKSRRAWDESGYGAYPKDPRTKWWDGYRGQEYVIIDEFRGTIDIGHMLRWLDRYPVLVERKGSSMPLSAKKFWITSNLHPDFWYPDLDSTTLAALKRRMEIVLIE